MPPTLPANLPAAESSDLIAAAQHDGDPLHRELAARLSLAEELADRLGSGDEMRALRAQLAAALRRMDDDAATIASLRAELAARDRDVRLWAARAQQAEMQRPVNDPDDAHYFAGAR